MVLLIKKVTGLFLSNQRVLFQCFVTIYAQLGLQHWVLCHSRLVWVVALINRLFTNYKVGMNSFWLNLVDGFK